MDLRHLRYIIASARNGSFSAAAQELNVRQPIVSKRVKEVEDEFGVCLFDRSKSGASLTAERARLNRDTGDAYAEGNVILQHGATWWRVANG